MEKQAIHTQQEVTTSLNQISAKLRQMRESHVSSGSAIYERDGGLITVTIPSISTNKEK